MPVCEQNYFIYTPNALKEIAKQMKISNQLKALEMKILYSHNTSDIEQIFKDN